METTITAESPIATFDKVVLVERIQFIREAKSAATVKIMHDSYLYAEFNGTINIEYDRPGRHPDLLPRWSGTYEVIGMLEDDRIIVTYRTETPKPEPLHPREIERLQKAWHRERLQKESQRFANLRSWN